MAPEVHRLAAFTTDPGGGNPAGVVVTDQALDAARMQRIAADVGFSETAFLVPGASQGVWSVRYFAPESEVPFCGHATIAAGVTLGRMGGSGRAAFDTAAGRVHVDIDAGGAFPTATLTSVPPTVEGADDALVDAALATMGWRREVLDPTLEPALADAGARHLLLPLRTRELLAALTYDFGALRSLSQEARLITVALLWRETSHRLHARNLFPIGGVVEDPATGAAAAAVGAWLRASRALDPPATVEILQGEDMGRPSLLTVDIPAGSGGIAVTGTAVDL
jgi:PhzF family phenazine biosynthesis protein